MRDFFPWALQTLVRGETVTVSKLAALPPEAARDEKPHQRYGTQSVVVIPLFAGALYSCANLRRDARGTAVAGRRREGFRMVAEVIANALARRRADRALQESQARLTLAAASADARLWEVGPDNERVWMTEEGRAFLA